MSRLRLVTLNTWKNEGHYTSRVAAMAQQLAALDADVIALQECFACEAKGDDTAAVLAEATGLCLTRAPMRRKPRAHHGQTLLSSSGLALLTRQAPLVSRLVALPEDPRDGQRLAIVADVLAAPGGLLRVATTHLTHLRDDEANRVRALQAQTLLAAAREGLFSPVVIMGDLNDPPDAPALASLFGDSELDRASAPAPVAAQDRLRLGAIDHVLVYGAADVWQVERRWLCVTAPCADGGAPSDHPGVCLDLVAV